VSPFTAIVLDLGAPRGVSPRLWRHREDDCLRALSPAQVLPVRGAAEAEAAAREAALQGARTLVAAGGAAAAHGVLNALMNLAETHRAAIKFGVLNLDGRDPWARTLGWPQPLVRQLEVLRAGNALPHDVGRVQCQDAQGRLVTRHFLNGASFGIAEELRAAWRRGEARAPDALARTLRLLSGIEQVSLRLQSLADGGAAEIHHGPWVAGVLMVGRYYPGLGEVAPEADPCDGALDLIGITGRPDWRALGWLTGLVPRARGLTSARGAAFTVSCPGAALHLELDGVPAGQLPASFTALPRQLHTIVPTVAARLMKPKFAPIPAVAERPIVAGRVCA
jgi:diacylglycerol kinase (ATP)